jgi:hypothetical protein
VTPAELAALYPRLYHLTDPRNLDGTLAHGLLPTSGLLALFEVPNADRPSIERRRRPKSVSLTHPRRGAAVINDNVPLSEGALANCLDGGLAPADWLAMLNARVFFWPDEEDLASHLNARLNRGRERLVLVLDTLSVATQYQEQIELSPINSGATFRKPARRGPSTFTPMLRHDYAAWRRLRGGRDRIREVVVVGGIHHIEDHLIEHRLVSPKARDAAPAVAAREAVPRA